MSSGFSFFADEVAYRAQPGRQAVMPGVTMPSWACPCCNQPRRIAGRKKTETDQGARRAMKRDSDMVKHMESLRNILEGWADWQRAYAPKLGYPSRSLTCYSEGSQDFESLCDAVDGQTFATVDACVQDLVPAQRAAVMRRYGIAA